MLLFEAKHELESRLALKSHYKDNGIDDYFEALEIAVKCIQAQQELINVLNEWDIDEEVAKGDTYSARLCYDIVRQFSIFEEDEINGENE